MHSQTPLPFFMDEQEDIALINSLFERNPLNHRYNNKCNKFGSGAKTKRRMSQCSLDMYFDKILPELSPRQSIVYNCIINNKVSGLTLREAANILGLKMHTISGRFTELRDKGLIKRSGIRREDSDVHILNNYGEK